VPGQVTDDTHLACCVAAALRPDGVDLDALVASYVAWAPVTFDIGNLTRGAISGLARGDREAGRRVWRASDHNAAPNGSLMRTAPIGVRYADPDRRRQAAFDDSALTHYDPRCQLACAAYDAAIAAAVAGVSTSPNPAPNQPCTTASSATGVPASSPA
jgi:ADP-ribosylglycohydrolase